MDEARVSNIARTPAWIATEYNNQNSPSTFETLGSQTTNNVASTTVANNLSIGGAGSATVDEFTNNLGLAIPGSLTIGSGGTFLASQATTTISGNLTVNGSFTHNSGVLAFAPTSVSTITAATSTSFYDLSIASPGKTLQFQASSGTVFTIADKMRVKGSAGNLININSNSGGSQWKVHFTQAQGTGNMVYALVKDSGCDAGSANASLNDGTSQNGGNNGACWLLPAVVVVKSNIGGGGMGGGNVLPIEGGSGGTGAAVGGGGEGGAAASGASGGVTLVAANASNGVNETNEPLNTTGATLLIAAVYDANQNPTTDTVSDTYNNTWFHLNNYSGITLWYAKSPVTGTADWFTVIGGSTPYIRASAWKGTDLASPYDVQNGNSNSNSESLQTGSITPGGNSELIISAYVSITGSRAIDSGFNFCSSGDSSSYLTTAYLVQSTATAVNPTWSESLTPWNNYAIIAAFKAGSNSSSGGGTTQPTGGGEGGNGSAQGGGSSQGGSGSGGTGASP